VNVLSHTRMSVRQLTHLRSKKIQALLDGAQSGLGTAAELRMLALQICRYLATLLGQLGQRVAHVVTALHHCGMARMGSVLDARKARLYCVTKPIVGPRKLVNRLRVLAERVIGVLLQEAEPIPEAVLGVRQADLLLQLEHILPELPDVA